MPARGTARPRRECADPRGRGVRRSEGPASPRTARARRAVSWDRDRRSGRGSDCRCPTRRVLPLPVGHRCVVAQNAARRGIDAQRATRPLRDVAQMAEQVGLRALLDRLADGRAGANALDEVRDVQCRELIIATRREWIVNRRCDVLLHDLPVQVVHDVAVLIEDHRPRRAMHDRPAAAVFDGIGIAAPTLPRDRSAALELERRFLSVGELPGVLEVVAAARGGDAHGMIYAEGPARDVDLMRAVVAYLAPAPAADPVPVVVTHVVPVPRARRRSLPQLVIEIRRYRYRLAVADGRAAVGVPRAREVGAADDPVANSLDRFDGARR